VPAIRSAEIVEGTSVTVGGAGKGLLLGAAWAASENMIKVPKDTKSHFVFFTILPQKKD
jgi:hypothetical protein